MTSSRFLSQPSLVSSCFSCLAEGAKGDAPAASSRPSPVRLREPAPPPPRDPELREDSTPGRRLEVGRGLSLTRRPPRSCFPRGGQKSGDKKSSLGLRDVTSGTSDSSQTHPSNVMSLGRETEEDGPEIFTHLVTLTKWKGVSISVSLRIPCSAPVSILPPLTTHCPQCPPIMLDLCFTFEEAQE